MRQLWTGVGEPTKCKVCFSVEISLPGEASLLAKVSVCIMGGN